MRRPPGEGDPSRAIERSACRALGVLPSPLWGGVGGGGSSWRTHLVKQQRPPSPPLPHKGGGSRPSLPLERSPISAPRGELLRLAMDRRVRPGDDSLSWAAMVA